ncbi:Prolipoprotein diacylglyceryl transferase [Caldalkalibacillus thermarum TA2.A1]|uniref:Phosphatidylglycerol--prolipoprotein diacylglyceryl transferase n=1 Tax=Caldalkalibacillus thermarum (strain TA2.A1) TaxID=986075 RepID=F5L6V1_CALTT|nr:prolipoprotein diacylglyceryl transferase [Caldalkalibacillus thermarum]EGL82937.1 Prolipoprotein diacylglyceryl transferase [Caldalkalibacillus thermarum TA2.A1]QZT33900.1 prolipoprotein diacylglyceryl transferase [Caldalkalibacillus thermarum TA2.A1]
MSEHFAAEAIQPLDPIAFQLGPLSVHWYGVIIGFGALLGLLWAIKEGKRHGIVPDTFLDLMVYGLPVAVIGARTYYVIFQWDYYRENPADIIAIWKGGLAIHGALIGAVLVAIWFSRKRNISFWKLMDIVAPGFILGQAIGRWGNFMNQEAHGGVVSREFLESLYLPEFIINQMYIYNPAPGGGLDPGFYYHHPTFLYESLWNLLGFVVLIGIRRLNIRQGELFLSYLIWYSTGRFFIEGLRTDSLMLTEFLRAAQVMSITLIIVAVAVMILRRQLGWAKNSYWTPVTAQTVQEKKGPKRKGKKKKR